MSKIMNFADGPKEVVIGMKVVYSNGQSGRYNHMLNESTIDKIGNKLVTLKNGDKFYLEDGTKQTEYVSGKLYSSKEAYELSLKQDKIIRQVNDKIRSFGNSITYDQALKIADIIGLKLEN